MDVATLLYRSRRTRTEDYPRKAIALRSGYAIVKEIDPTIDVHTFLARAAGVASCVFGGNAQDAYLTTALSAVASVQPEMDLYLAAVLNAVVLQLGFQTRIFLDGSQSAVFDGPQDIFIAAMLHANVTQGIRVAEAAGQIALPVWANATNALEVNAEQVFELSPDLVVQYLSANGSRHLGALLIAPADSVKAEFRIDERFSYLADSVGPETQFCIGGTAEMVFGVAAELQKNYSALQLAIKGYSRSEGRGRQNRAVLVFAGLDQLPAVTLRTGVSVPCTFGYGIDQNEGDLDSISYGNSTIEGVDWPNPGGESHKNVRGIWETAPVRKPFLVSSSAPLPLEARQRISGSNEIFHSTLAIRDGILIPIDEPGYANFLCANRDGKIVTGCGMDPSGCSLYEAARVDDRGVRSNAIQADRLTQIEGAAMPLMFTPQLHKWHSHFMIQCLPRVRIARDLGLDMTILLPHDLRKKQLEMLEILGFGADRVVMMQPGDLVQAESLYFPWPWHLTFTKYSMAIYDEIAAHFDTSKYKTPKRLLVSRQSRKSWRNLINYDAVRKMLIDDFGFEELSAEKLSLEEEIATYANAEIIVGAEGAGMYGAVFSNSRAKYITMCDEDYVMPILGRIAAIHEFEVGYVFGESLRSDRDVSRRLNFGHSDFMIDVGRLGDAVTRALAI